MTIMKIVVIVSLLSCILTMTHSCGSGSSGSDWSSSSSTWNTKGSSEKEKNVLEKCFETWSRCSKWTYWGTGRLWKHCSERCEELGFDFGLCEEQPSECPLSKMAFTCMCKCHDPPINFECKRLN